MPYSNLAIIVAAGQGKRIGRPKQFLNIAGRPMLWWTLSVFQKAEVIDGIILVVNKEEINRAKKFKFSKILKIVVGGKRRQDSVYNGLRVLPEDAEIVAIHDGARPLVATEIITRAVREAKKFGAVVVGVPVKDTIKVVQRPKSNVQGTLERGKLWQVQTPQVFRKEVIVRAYQKGYNKYFATDDSFLVEKLGCPVRIAMGSYENIKITTAEDMVLAEAILKRRR